MIASTDLRIGMTLIAVILIACGGSTPEDLPLKQTTANGIMLDSAQSSEIRTVTVERTQYAPAVVTTGIVHFNGERSTQVIAPISGPVSGLVANLGDVVGQGSMLATVASPDFAEAVADYRRAISAWRNAERIDNLNQKLLETGALPRAERDQSASDLVEAEADRDAAASLLQSLGISQETLSTMQSGGTVEQLAPAIRAPIPGTVVERLITPGQLLEAGATATFTIADLGSMWIDANVFGPELAGVRVGDRAVVTSDATVDSIIGRVDYIGALVDPDTRATAVRIVVPNPGRTLRQNMLVRVKIASARTREAVLVPVSTVLRDDENLPFLFIKSGSGVYQRRRVTLGQRTGDNYEILDGLEGGELVVSKGGLYLSEAGTS